MLFGLARRSTGTTLMAGEAAAEVKSGTTVVFETNDYNYAALSRGEEVDLETVNVVTGPLRVTGAQPGDVLRVDILDIRITRCWSVWASDAKACGCLAAKRALFSRDSSVRELPVEGGRVTVSERLRLPLRPDDWLSRHGLGRPVSQQHLRAHISQRRKHGPATGRAGKTPSCSPCWSREACFLSGTSTRPWDKESPHGSDSRQRERPPSELHC